MSDIRTLEPKDAKALDAFLKQHLAGSQYLLAQLNHGGLDYKTGPSQAHYLAVFEKKTLKGVLALCNSGYVLTQCPDLKLLDQLVQNWAEWFKGSTIGVIGPKDQTDRIINHLGDEELPYRFNNTEQILSLPPGKFIPPATGLPYTVRLATTEDAEHLYGWRTALLHEIANMDLTPELVEQVRADVDGEIATRNLAVLDINGQAAGMGQVLDRQNGLVQLGAVYLPPELRNRGIGRALIGGLTRLVPDDTVVIFTTKRHISLNRAALRLGFHFHGEQSVVLFDEPVSPKQ